MHKTFEEELDLKENYDVFIYTFRYFAKNKYICNSVLKELVFWAPSINFTFFQHNVLYIKSLDLLDKSQGLESCPKQATLTEMTD
jgi:hypothetical protein